MMLARSGILCLSLGVFAAESAELTAIWANNGEDKIVQSQLRASQSPSKVTNRLWDGRRIVLFGAQNEVVNFNLVLEAARGEARDVSVQFPALKGPGGAEISSPAPDPSAIFTWTQRNIELFFVRYLQIRGLSYFGYNSGASGFDERIVPKGLQRPWKDNAYTSAKGGWTDRPNHDAYYPDIAVPLELHSKFNVSARANQSVWVDIYIPKNSPAGLYKGVLTVGEGSAPTREIPVELSVLNFSLPDMPSSKTMLFYSLTDVARRLTGVRFPQPGSKEFARAQKASLAATQLAHRHKISLLTDWGDDKADHPSNDWADALSGRLFTAKRGYAGPGEGVGNNVYAILAYGGFRNAWKSPEAADVTKEDVWLHANRWETWFQKNAPSTERFLYLCDECAGNGSDGKPTPQQVDQWARWLKENPGVGKSLRSFATIGFDAAAEKEPNVDYIANTSLGNGNISKDTTGLYNRSVGALRSRKGSRLMFYNPARPAAGSFALEDDGVALREVAWAQYKKGIDRLFYWQSTYYWDFQSNGKPEPNLFQQAATFGGSQSGPDPLRGEWNPTHTNGEGVLFYPGKDMLFPKDSYGVDGLFASLRLKYWRRGIQDVDYITLAAAVDQARTQKIVDRMVPRAFWDYKDLGGWMIDDISWSINPDDWESARAELAQIIDKR